MNNEEILKEVFNILKDNLKKIRLANPSKDIEDYDKKVCELSCIMIRKGVKEALRLKDKEFLEKVEELNVYLCSKLEGECLLKQKDIKEIYKEINKIFSEEKGK